MSITNTDQYFATVSASEIGNELQELVQQYDQFITSNSGYLPLWRASYNQFYSNVYTRGQMTTSGEQGEYTNVGANHYSNILLHIKNICTNQKVVWDARATNSDAKSIKQTITANAVLEYYNKTLKLDANMRQVLEYSLLFGEGFIECVWNRSLGELYAVTENDAGHQVPVYSGDCESHIYTPNHVVRPYSGNDWYILRRKVNKFDLCANNPEKEQDILAVSNDSVRFSIELDTLNINKRDANSVYLYTFYHKRTPACPEGRLTTFLTADCVLFDGALPYKDIPVNRLVPVERNGTNFGHSVMFDILPLQQNLDILYSTVATNHAAFGVNRIIAPANSGVTSSMLAGGLDLITYTNTADGGRPEVLQLCATPPEIFNQMQIIVTDMERISGVNSVVRGESPGANISGAALNLLQQTSVQFANSLIANYIGCIEDLGTNVVNILKSYAKTERIIEVVGKSNTINSQSFKSDDISDINRVVVEVGNPMSHTIAGRVALADSLLEKGLVDARSYIQVVETGQLDDMLEAPRAQILLIKSENEMLMEGELPQAIVFDDHNTHIKEHATILGSVEARRDPELIQRVLQHINEHKMLLETSDPFLLNINNPQAAPAPAQPTPPQAAPMNSVAPAETMPAAPAPINNLPLQ